MKTSTNREDIIDDGAIHPEMIRAIREQMIDGLSISDMADLFKVLGDATRVKILAAVSVSEMCVCDIAVLLSMSNSAISHQLRVLKQAHIVRSRRDGKAVFYSMADEHIAELMQTALDHSREE